MLIGIVSIGGILRLWHLGGWSFWIDEVLTVLDAQNFSLSNSPINPLPYIAVKLSLTIAGDTEWGSRLIPCVVGILSIPVVFGFGRTLFNRRVGLLAATFVALSSWHLFWSQNARSYIFTFLFAVLTAWFFYIALERNSLIFMGGALVSCICLILSHVLAVVIVPALAVYAVLCLLEARTRKRWLILLLFFMPFALPVLLLALPQIRDYFFAGWGRNEWQRSPLYIVLTLVQGVSIPVAVTAFFAVITKPTERGIRFLSCYAGVGLALLLVASQFQNVAGYYLFWTTPAYFILAAVGCTTIWEAHVADKSYLSKALLPALLIIVLLSQAYLYFNLENGGRPKWREAFAAIRTQMKPIDSIVLSEPQMGTYYLPEMEAFDADRLLRDAEGFEKQWTPLGKRRLWFLVDVASFNVFDANQKVRDWIRQRGRMVRTLPAYARAKDRTIHIYLWE